MYQQIIDYVLTCEEPDFFHAPDTPSLSQAHDAVRQSIERATATITVELDEDLKSAAEKVLSGIGWTVEEALVLFLYWCVSCPERLTAWAEEQGLTNNVTVSDSGAVSLKQQVLDAFTENCDSEGENLCST